MTKLQARRMRRWIRALRSGKFKKTRNVLRRGDCFCASGVACELFRRARRKETKWSRLKSESEARPAGAYSLIIGDSPHTWDVTMPWMIRDWFGLPTGKTYFIPQALVKEWKLNPKFDAEGISVEVLNDGADTGAAFVRRHRPMSFPKIADVLERWLDTQEIAA